MSRPSGIHEVVRVLTECARRARLRAVRRRKARPDAPGRLRENDRERSLPVVRHPLRRLDDQPVVPAEHRVRVRKLEQPLVRIARQLEQRERLISRLGPGVVVGTNGHIRAGGVAPAAVVFSPFVHVVHHHAEILHQLVLEADDELVRVRVLEVRVDRQVRVVGDLLEVDAVAAESNSKRNRGVTDGDVLSNSPVTIPR